MPSKQTAYSAILKANVRKSLEIRKYSDKFVLLYRLFRGFAQVFDDFMPMRRGLMPFAMSNFLNFETMKKVTMKIKVQKNHISWTIKCPPKVIKGGKSI